MTFYSDNGVDQAVEALLPEFGYAVDVGANNGEFNSNTYCFEQKGWYVLCAEPNPWLVEDGRQRRKLWREVACGSKNGFGEFWIVGEKPWGSASALIVNGNVPYAGSGADPYYGGSVPDSHRIRVQIKRLDDLIEEAGFPRVDYLSIDVEGSEDDVLAGFTVERWKPKVIVVENYPEPKTPPPPGYTKFDRKLYDEIFVRNDA